MENVISINEAPGAGRRFARGENGRHVYALAADSYGSQGCMIEVRYQLDDGESIRSAIDRAQKQVKITFVLLFGRQPGRAWAGTTPAA